MADLRYPIGDYVSPREISPAQIAEWIDQIAALPAALRHSVTGLNSKQLDTPYRPDGWTVRQVVHHLPDSHMNSYVRFRWALTEDQPLIKAYYEDRWAEMNDARTAPIEISLSLLDSLHARWELMLRNLSAEDLQRSFKHPEGNKTIRLDVNIGLYAWHGNHHVAHINALRRRKGW